MARRGRTGAPRRQGLQPLRRRPKQLTDEPGLYEPSRGAGGLVLVSGGPRRRPGGRGGGGTTSATTDEPAEVIPLADLTDTADADARTRRRAELIAQRLSVPRPPRDRRARRGTGDLVSVAWTGASDELDLERTVESIAGTPFPEGSDVVVRERLRRRRSVVLVVDVSGSMRGERVRTAAATVGALAGELVRDRLAVVAFWSAAAVLSELGETVEPRTLLDLLLRVPTEGLTNVGFALEVAGKQLSGMPPRDSRVLLLSDCVHNAGPDPRIAAHRLPRLDVLVDTSSENDVELGRDLARAGRGQCRPVRDHRDVASALTAILTD